MTTVHPFNSGPNYDFCVFSDFDPNESMLSYDRGLIQDPKREIRAYPSGVMWFTLVEGPNRGVHLCSGLVYSLFFLGHFAQSF